MLLITLCMGLAACATQGLNLRDYDIAAEDRFVPINLSVTAGDYVIPETAALMRHLTNSIETSGHFSEIERSLDRWPYTVAIRYANEAGLSAGEFAGMMTSIVTVGIVPAPTTEPHVLYVRVLHGNRVIREARYEHVIKSSFSIWRGYTVGLWNDRQRAVNALLEEMFEDFRSNAMLPTLRDVMPTDEPIHTSI